MRKIVLLCLVLVLVTGCSSGFMHSDMTRAITPDNKEYPDRESYIKAIGLDKNPEKPVAVITALPYDGVIESRGPFIAEKKGYLELCVAKALKEVIPDIAVYFDIRPDTIAIYKIEKAFVGYDALLVKRSKLTTGTTSWFVEIYGKLAINNKTMELNGAGAKLGILRTDDMHYCTWNACLDVANQIADVLVKEGYLRADQIKKAKVEK